MTIRGANRVPQAQARYLTDYQAACEAAEGER